MKVVILGDYIFPLIWLRVLSGRSDSSCLCLALGACFVGRNKMEEDKGTYLVENQDLNLVTEDNMREPHCCGMEVETGISGMSGQSFVSDTEKGEGSTGNVVFSGQTPHVGKDFRGPGGPCISGVKKHKFRQADSDPEPGKNEKSGQEKKLSKQDRIELGRSFQDAVTSHDWAHAESLTFLADPQTLNDALCIALDSIWFLSTQEELCGITGLIKKIISNGAYDFTRAALRTSFLASCVCACQSRTMSLSDTVTVMAQR